MKKTILIPTPLRPFINQQEEVETTATTVNEALQDLALNFPKIKQHLYDKEDNLRKFINIYVNDSDIRDLKGVETPLSENDEISLVPAIAEGLIIMTTLSQDEINRYSRHLILPEVGPKGQEALKASSVLCIGAGGLGCPLLLYLAAAGVGRIGIVDFDVIDESNLQRQVLYGVSTVGQSKAQVAKQKLLDLNPHITVDVHEVRLTSDNALDLFKDYDVIADGTDNFATRYLVNDACVLTGKPNVYGSIFRFEGMVSVFNYQNGPNYRCLYSEPPPPGLVPSCAEGGVLGVLPGVVATLQANEVIKVLLGMGDVASGRLIRFNALKLEFKELKVTKRDDYEINELIDYEQFCGIPQQEEKWYQKYLYIN